MGNVPRAALGQSARLGALGSSRKPEYTGSRPLKEWVLPAVWDFEVEDSRGSLSRPAGGPHFLLKRTSSTDN